MTGTPVIDKVFADNLGTAFGGCVRDQCVSLFSREIPRAAGVDWNPLPFIGREAKTRFRARWAALLQGIGLWVALTEIPELAAEDKLSRKISSQLQAYTDAVLKAPLIDHLTADEVRDYNLLRQRFMRMATITSTPPSNDQFARAFLSAVSGRTPSEIPGDRILKLSAQITLAANLFRKLARICRDDPQSYERASKKN
ncbi:hypothetical protein [Sutterella sp.]|uniref:hypothetical protein n=1 Tax=Sutterella sp. TaxID=1981025 RepID=UPI0026DF1BFC|nr:hypothetical protein [Sutterella sp.]MDO5530554.1 hypothetical protein [Sutterella sp.]